ncbi:transposase [uncultured Desulfobacter sp.]|uniref:IS110 family transposase n=1 Tax=uncultured Desulfobacter sp. TaxID=240139 RepID=UPI003747FEAC
MRNWLTENECPILAMESTGVYWRPVHKVLEGFMEVILVNARHINNVPGRKTDIADSKWLAGLWCYFGVLFRGSDRGNLLNY